MKIIKKKLIEKTNKDEETNMIPDYNSVKIWEKRVQEIGNFGWLLTDEIS